MNNLMTGYWDTFKGPGKVHIKPGDWEHALCRLRADPQAKFHVVYQGVDKGQVTCQKCREILETFDQVWSSINMRFHNGEDDDGQGFQE